jgi:hypothetical protein
MLCTIKINIVFGLTFNALAVVASGMGWLTPIMAAIVHNVGSVLVVLALASLAIFPEDSSCEMVYRRITSIGPTKVFIHLNPAAELPCIKRFGWLFARP